MHHLTCLLHSVDPSGDAYLTQEEHVIEMLTRILKIQQKATLVREIRHEVEC